MHEYEAFEGDTFDELWPDLAKEDGDVLSLVSKKIYENIAKTEKKIFHSKFSDKWVSWKSCYIPKFATVPLALKTVYHEVLLEYLKETNGKDAEIVELIPRSEKGLKAHGLAERTFSIQKFYTEVFLPRAKEIDEEKRNKILKCLLDTCNDDNVLKLKLVHY